MTLPPETLKVELLDPHGEKGGQQVYPRPMAVRVTHLPTEMQVTVHGRSQRRARDIAISMIEWGLIQ